MRNSTTHGAAPRGRHLVIAALALTGLATFSSAHADVVTDWNEIALETQFAVPLGIRTPTASRALAMMHLAVFDAINSIDRRFTPYAMKGASDPAASPDAAAVAAAHAVLVDLYPSRQAVLDAAYATSLAAIPDGIAKAEGIAVGESAAADILALRASDGSGVSAPYTACPPLPSADCPPGIYQPAPLEGMQAIFVAWGKVKPFALNSGSQFRVEGPPGLSSSEYAADFGEVKSVGALDSAVRTPDETQAALFWRENIQIPWNRIAQKVATGSLTDDARLFALLNMAAVDTTIAVMDTKYTYDFWRPREAVHAGDVDGNDQTAGDPGWKPLGYIANHPDYDSQHAAVGAAAATVLASLLGTDDFSFDLTTSTAPGGVSRSYESFSQAAVENMNSRVWLGAHFRTGCRHGFNQGKQVAHYVVNRFLQPIGK